MNVIEIAGFIIGGAGALGFAAAALYTGRAKSVIELQQDELQALRDSNERLRADNHTLTYQNATLEAHSKDLKDMVTSVPEFGKLTLQMAEQHKEVTKSLGDVARGLADLTRAITKQNSNGTH